MQHGAGLNEIALAFVNTTSRSYFGKMNSTLGSVVPLAMFSFWASEQKTVRTGLDCIILKTGTTTRAPAMLKLIIISGKSTSY